MSVGDTNYHSNASEPPSNIQVIITEPTSFTNPVPRTPDLSEDRTARINEAIFELIDSLTISTVYGMAKYGTVPYTYGHNSLHQDGQRYRYFPIPYRYGADPYLKHEQVGRCHLPKMEIHQKMKVVALIEHYKVDQLTIVIS
jgi:hypothetical protein